MEMIVQDVSDDASNNGLTEVQEQVLTSTNPPSEYTLQSNNKKIQFKKPSGIVSMQIAEILGDQSLNPALNIYYRMAFSICSIDGMAVRTPKSKAEIMAVIQRLGDEDAFGEAVALFGEYSGLSMGEIDSAKK